MVSPSQRPPACQRSASTALRHPPPSPGSLQRLQAFRHRRGQHVQAAHFAAKLDACREHDGHRWLSLHASSQPWPPCCPEGRTPRWRPASPTPALRSKQPTRPRRAPAGAGRPAASWPAAARPRWRASCPPASAECGTRQASTRGAGRRQLSQPTNPLAHAPICYSKPIDPLVMTNTPAHPGGPHLRAQHLSLDVQVEGRQRGDVFQARHRLHVRLAVRRAARRGGRGRRGGGEAGGREG